MAAALAVALAIAAPSLAVDPEDVANSFSRSSEYKNYIDVHNEHEDSMKMQAEETFRKMQAERLPEIDRLKKDILQGRTSDPNSHPDSQGNAIASRLADDERIYIFVSSSIPETSLKEYARSLDKLRDQNASMVMRGCIGGCTRIIPTLKYIQKIIASEKGKELVAEVQIDPNLFRAYKIEVVPAIIFARGISKTLPEISEGIESNLKTAPEAYAVYGDVSLDYALEKINRDLGNPRLAQTIQVLRKGWFD